MRYLILSDLHANDDALSAVLAEVAGQRFDAVLLLGDLVGYCAGPNEVVAAIRDLPWPVRAVRGNHDRAALAPADSFSFNETALEATTWTARRLDGESRRYLGSLPRGPLLLPEESAAICHGSPLDEDGYLLSARDAQEVFEATELHLVFFGHTHLQSAFTLGGGTGVDVRLLRGPAGRLRIEKHRRYLLNPGSVGQPRDRDPDAAYMVYDSALRMVAWRRCPYDVARAQRRISEAGLPSLLAERLALGI